MNKLNIVSKVDSKWKIGDYLGSIRTMLGIRRNSYSIAPGLYKLGNPDKNSMVIVTANYKYTFDIVRRDLKEQSVWILVLDTKGVNVWCAAGKGTFGSDELINRIKTVRLDSLVSHHKLIVPQLGAPGIDPQKIKIETGFSVTYGPVDSSDLNFFLKNSLKATEEMRTKRFLLSERARVSTTHYFQALLPGLGIAFVFGILDLALEQFSLDHFFSIMLINILFVFAATTIASIIAGILLPILPGRAFSIKGAFLGILFAIISFYLLRNISAGTNIYLIGKIGVLICWITYNVLNITGSTTFTSLPGVQKEMTISVPIILGVLLLSISAIVVGGFLL